MSDPTVAYQGEPGSFSEQAALEHFGRARCVGYGSFAAAVRAVAEREAEYGVLPVENTCYGKIAEVYRELSPYAQLRIAGTVRLRIVQALVGVAGATLDVVRSVASHRVALAQCRRFLAAHPRLDVQIVDDTAGAVRAVIAQGDVAFAAIGPAGCAQRYGGSVLVPDVTDSASNSTRFVIVSHR